MSILFSFGRIFISILIYCVSSSTFAYEQNPFTAANLLAQDDIIASQSTETGYRLSNTISRAEIIKIAIRLTGQNQLDCRNSTSRIFTDVGSPLGDLCGYIERAASIGIIQQSDTSGRKINFRPNAPVTRAEMTKILLTAIGESPSSTLSLFSDVGSSLGNLQGYINRVSELGCVGTVSNNRFRPRVPAIRGEVFQMAICLRELRATNIGVSNSGSGIVESGSSGSIQSSASLEPSLYRWSLGEYGVCSKSCGEGVQTRTVTCKRISDNMNVSDTFCAIASHLQKPVTQKLCNVKICSNTSSAIIALEPTRAVMVNTGGILTGSIQNNSGLVLQEYFCAITANAENMYNEIPLPWTTGFARRTCESQSAAMALAIYIRNGFGYTNDGIAKRDYIFLNFQNEFADYALRYNMPWDGEKKFTKYPTYNRGQKTFLGVQLGDDPKKIGLNNGVMVPPQYIKTSLTSITSSVGIVNQGSCSWNSHDIAGPVGEIFPSPTTTACTASIMGTQAREVGTNRLVATCTCNQ